MRALAVVMERPIQAVIERVLRRLPGRCGLRVCLVRGSGRCGDCCLISGVISLLILAIGIAIGCLPFILFH
jgi:hypothetical protein